MKDIEEKQRKEDLKQKKMKQKDKRVIPRGRRSVWKNKNKEIRKIKIIKRWNEEKR